ncbi:MAG: hypothetical protein A3E36_04480 [Candidatus Andersenbacteria bacterium RIFCSPHIGHO2_12_FULL_45_11b]|uniref:DUF5666 domain-containing protein n=1 Tax=Candidatus Andersenbacteria bacterium RIFCSPHIGHO2_12_FULL_45_11b TaxID=1797282 RepID=A0A1G1X9N2_9BACT|nr:MAG: hypothetical protein A3E36_04480 [Candidatus Andersenbacteria bacterium RIFCSPHIGHO2_12_FULL_45_11b]
MKLSSLSVKLGIAGIAAFALAVALPAFAADYPFVLRGVVDVKAPTKSIVYVTVTSASAKAVAETQNINLGYSISNAKIYGYVNGVKKPVSWTQLKMGNEVVMKGNKVGGTFKVSELTINDRSFEMLGRVRDLNTDNKTITVQVARSTYRESGIKGNNIIINYSGTTACKRLGSTISCSTINTPDNIIKIIGSVTGTNQKYEATKIWAQYLP